VRGGELGPGVVGGFGELEAELRLESTHLVEGLATCRTGGGLDGALCLWTSSTTGLLASGAACPDGLSLAATDGWAVEAVCFGTHIVVFFFGSGLNMGFCIGRSQTL
jgi:hypothetical protein